MSRSRGRDERSWSNEYLLEMVEFGREAYRDLARFDELRREVLRRGLPLPRERRRGTLPRSECLDESATAGTPEPLSQWGAAFGMLHAPRTTMRRLQQAGIIYGACSFLLFSGVARLLRHVSREDTELGWVGAALAGPAATALTALGIGSFRGVAHLLGRPISWPFATNLSALSLVPLAVAANAVMVSGAVLSAVFESGVGTAVLLGCALYCLGLIVVGVRDWPAASATDGWGEPSAPPPVVTPLP